MFVYIRLLLLLVVGPIRAEIPPPLHVVESIHSVVIPLQKGFYQTPICLRKPPIAFQDDLPVLQCNIGKPF